MPTSPASTILSFGKHCNGTGGTQRRKRSGFNLEDFLSVFKLCFHKRKSEAVELIWGVPKLRRERSTLQPSLQTQ